MIKKITSLSFLLAVVFCINLNAQVNLSNGLLVHLPFTGNAMDSSGNGKNGTVNNATLTEDRCGKANSAYYFNGTDAYIEVPSGTLLNNYYSFSIWANAEEIPASGDYTYPFAIGASGGGQNIALCNNSMKGWAGGSYNNGSPSLSLVAIGSQPQTDEWYHIVFIRDTNKIKLYINGVLNTNETSYSGANTNTGGTSPVYGSGAKALIGNRDLSSQFYFKGSIDDIRIYNRVINYDEIDSLYREKMCFFTGINNIISAGKVRLKVYPNPAAGEFSVDIENNDEETHISILNSLGQEIYAKSIREAKEHINISGLASGIYNVTVRSSSGTVSHKVLLMK